MSPPIRPHLLSLENTATSWEPSIQILDPMGDTLIQTTANTFQVTFIGKCLSLQAITEHHLLCKGSCQLQSREFLLVIFLPMFVLSPTHFSHMYVCVHTHKTIPLLAPLLPHSQEQMLLHETTNILFVSFNTEIVFGIFSDNVTQNVLA